MYVAALGGPVSVPHLWCLEQSHVDKDGVHAVSGSVWLVDERDLKFKMAQENIRRRAKDEILVFLKKLANNLMNWLQLSANIILLMLMGCSWQFLATNNLPGK